MKNCATSERHKRKIDWIYVMWIPKKNCILCAIFHISCLKSIRISLFSSHKNRQTVPGTLLRDVSKDISISANFVFSMHKFTPFHFSPLVSFHHCQILFSLPAKSIIVTTINLLPGKIFPLLEIIMLKNVQNEIKSQFPFMFEFSHQHTLFTECLARHLLPLSPESELVWCILLPFSQYLTSWTVEKCEIERNENLKQRSSAQRELDNFFCTFAKLSIQFFHHQSAYCAQESFLVCRRELFRWKKKTTMADS